MSFLYLFNVFFSAKTKKKKILEKLIGKKSFNFTVYSLCSTEEMLTLIFPCFR